MWSLLLLVLSAGLCCGSDSGPENMETLMDHVLVLRVPYGVGTRVQVPLSCGDAFKNQQVVWKKNGEDTDPPLQGNQVQVLVEEMNGGNYTCHLPDGEYLNHTLVLVQLEPDNRTVILEELSPEEGHIRCAAHNYQGSFSCSWRRTRNRANAAVLLVRAQRNSEQVSCVLDAEGAGLRCQVASCAFDEEQHRVSLTVFLHSSSRLEAYSRTFYLRDIMRPARLPNLSVSGGRLFSWSYPDSWEKPCSFFSLQFEVRVFPRGSDCHADNPILRNVTEQTHFQVNVKPSRFVFCVRAQEKFTNGPFGHWSHCTVDKHTVC